MKISMLGGNSKEEIERRLRVVATAGNLSRADGTVSDVYESRYNYDANLKLARAVVGYGHKSISEHDYIVLAIEDVTPIIEQIIISYRLTSFTIKSRRNVDFRNVGFYVPEFRNNNGEILSNSKELQEEYKKYMQSLFDKYGSLVDKELPIEDCRYILPYSYYSNIIMGCDANELLRMCSDLEYGNLSNISEVKEFADKLREIITNNIPYLTRALDNEGKKDYYEDKFAFLDKELSDYDLYNTKVFNEARLTNYTEDADYIVCLNIITSRYQCSMEVARMILDEMISKDNNIMSKLMEGLIHSKNQRELEQVMFSFEMPISLAVLTHITRHRMHSLEIPDFIPMWNLDNYIVPSSIDNEYGSEYRDIFKNNKVMMEKFKYNGVREEDLIYFYLSGNTCNIHTTMNARSLEWISRMRCCNKAQWEIRNLIKKCVSDVKEVAPYIGCGLGPTCEVLGYCPEGKDSCKNRGVVIKKLEKKN